MESETMKNTTKRTALDVWLEDNDAIHIASAKLPGKGGVLQTWQVRGKVIISQAYADNHGWDVYVPVSDAMNAAETLKALADYCNK